MKNLITQTIVLFTIVNGVHAESLQGEWKGSYILNAYVNRINLYVLEEDNQFSATLDAIDANAMDLSYEIQANGDSVRFSRINSQGDLIEFSGVRTEGIITGMVVLHNEWMKDKPGIFQLMKSNATIFKGLQLPTFTLSSVDNLTLNQETGQDKYVIWDFWATWCKPCVAKRPMLTELKESFGGKLEIVSISLDDDWDVVEEFRKEKYPMPWLHAIKSKKWEDPLIQKFVPEGLPYGYLVSPEGKVVAFGSQLHAENIMDTVTKHLK